MNIQFNFRLTQERRRTVYEQIQSSCSCDFGYYAMTSMSALIVALGLLIDSSAVVIGGMLLAPLFWHILGLAMSIAKGEVVRFKYHIWSLFKAVVLAVFLTMILFWVLPHQQEAGKELLSRGNPNILHLLIALFSGIAGAIAMAWPGISTSIVGVLIAAALVPPLATISYGLTASNLSIAGGATLLFIANLVAIVFAATLAFLVFGFRPTSSKKAKDIMQRDIKWTIVLLVLVGIPLTWSFYKANQDARNEIIIQDILVSNIKNLDKNDIKSIDTTDRGGIDSIEATLFTDQMIYPSMKEDLEKEMERLIKKNVDLNLIVISTEKI